jgi:antitoxin (DNA-binding transcriptional repressor) of toxin-antitoxin stability system
MTTAPLPTKVTSTELARNLSDILNRIQYRGERFIVERNGQVIADIRPAEKTKILTVAEFLELWKSLPRADDKFADDLEEILAMQSRTAPPEWDY